jgi:hypothetical protein
MPTCRHCGCSPALPPVMGCCPICGRLMCLPGCLWFLILAALLALALR